MAKSNQYPQVFLEKNLRRDILRGHPWIYESALSKGSQEPRAHSLCQVMDKKGEPLAWGFYDPQSPIAIRILSLGKSPPTEITLNEKFKSSFEMRQRLLNSDTNAYRFINGEGDRLPGLVCDVYNKLAVIQFDGAGPEGFWKQWPLEDWIKKIAGVEHVLVKHRKPKGSSKPASDSAGQIEENSVLTSNKIVENGVSFFVDSKMGQKTGFFLDQRENRAHVKRFSTGKSVLNLFSYTGGFSVYAGLGGARRVTSVDLSQSAIDGACKNWELNGLDSKSHIGICEDVFNYLEAEKDLFDVIVVDPPSMAKMEKQKDIAKKKYEELFALAIKRLNPGGHIFLSSCSSHITFLDFHEIVVESVAKARKVAQILRISGQGPDHPFPHTALEHRYLKFYHLVMD